MPAEAFMALALDEAANALALGDEPYGAVLVRDELVVTGRNQCVTGMDPTAHSEVMTIRNAAQQWGVRDLSGAVMYTSFEPCPMCCGAIIASGIRSVVIGAWPVSAEEQLGSYTFERLVELADLTAAFTVRRDVLTSDALEFYARLRSA